MHVFLPCECAQHTSFVYVRLRASAAVESGRKPRDFGSATLAWRAMVAVTFKGLTGQVYCVKTVRQGAVGR